MRKANPVTIRTSFASEADEFINHYIRMSSGVVGSQHYQKDVSILASTSFLALYVSFERFLSNLFSAYLNRDSKGFRTDLHSKLTSSIKTRFGEAVAERVWLLLPDHISMSDLPPLVDPKGYNLTFTSAAELKQKANLWLAPHFRARVNSLADEDDRLIDTAKAIRDYIAHGSPASTKSMNKGLANVSTGGGNNGLNRGTNEVYRIGSYLKTIHVDRSRFQIYAERLKTIFNKL